MGITDCDHICSRCGEHMSHCSLCADLPSAVVRVRSSRPTNEQQREDVAQDRAMRREADRRQGWR